MAIKTLDTKAQEPVGAINEVLADVITRIPTEPTTVAASTDGSASWPTSGFLGGFVREIVITGTDKTNFEIDLPAVGAGIIRTVFNASNEFIGIRESASRMWRLGPMSRAFCIANSASWRVSTIRPNEWYVFDNDFLGGSVTTTSKDVRFSDSSNASTLSLNQSDFQIGSLRHVLSASSAGGEFSVAVNANAFVSSAYVPKILNLGAPVSVSQTASNQENPSEAFTWRGGLMLTADETVGDNGVFFEMDESRDLVGITRAAATQTSVSLATPPKMSTTENTELVFEVNHDATRADFWIDGVHIGSSEANIPKTADITWTSQLAKTGELTGDARIIIDRATVLAATENVR